MRVLLVAPVAHKFPPLPLLKIGAGHVKGGDDVKLVVGRVLVAGDFDRVYVTSLFTWEWREACSCVRYYKALLNAETWLGGVYATVHYEHAKKHSGADYVHRGLLEWVEDEIPAYSLLKDTPWEGWDASLVHASRGCTSKCSYCVVPKMEGSIKGRESIKKFVMRDHRWIVIMDNDFLRNPYVDKIFKELRYFSRRKGYWIDFNQGLRAADIDLETAKKLSQLKVGLFGEEHRGIRIAYDFLSQTDAVEKAIRNLERAGIKPRNVHVYNLYNFRESPDEFFERVKRTLLLGANSYPMRYQPLESLEKNEFIDEKAGWTHEKLRWVEECRARFGKGGFFPPYAALVQRMKESKSFEEMFKPW